MSTRIILYSGKGGVGKTSLSAASAIGTARLGRRTLVVSTDAAHSLADALDEELAGEPRRILPKLDAVEIDVNRELASHWGVIHDYLTRFIAFRGVEETVAEATARQTRCFSPPSRRSTTSVPVGMSRTLTVVCPQLFQR